jgi:hypothetical protein
VTCAPYYWQRAGVRLQTLSLTRANLLGRAWWDLCRIQALCWQEGETGGVIGRPQATYHRHFTVVFASRRDAAACPGNECRMPTLPEKTCLVGKRGSVAQPCPSPSRVTLICPRAPAKSGISNLDSFNRSIISVIVLYPLAKMLWNASN